MAADRYALSEMLQETWEQRLIRVGGETRDLVAATRKLIEESRAAMAAADEGLTSQP